MTKTKPHKSQTAADLAPAPYNPRKITDDQMRALSASLKEFGDLSGVVFNKRSGNTVGGHQRIRAIDPKSIINKTALTDAQGTVATGYIQTPNGRIVYREVDWPPAKEKAANLAANKHGGTFDMGAVADMLKDLKLEGFDLDLTGFLGDDVLDIFGPAAGETDADSVPAVPKKPTTVMGDLYVMGEHRLLCGDSSDADQVSPLMDGHRAALLATDPPYGVAYGDETGQDNKFGVIANDENDGPKLQAFLERCFKAALPHLTDSAAWYLWHAQMTQGFFAAAAAAAAAVVIHRQIIWVKPSLVLGHGDFHWRHELCFYGWKKGHRAPWYADRKQTTVWELGRENDGIHPTQKPVEIFTRPMLYNTKVGEVCYEPFAGSGSQVIAAESMNRRCFAMELDPGYCDVIVARWEAFTGKKATRAV